jgi:hypothetical protein
MAGFQHFVPNATKVAKADLARLGIAHAFDGEIVTHSVVGIGPSGTPGMLVADSVRYPTERLGYHKDSQTWRKIPGSECWVGFCNDSRPTPNDLIRKRTLPGHPVKLEDGNTWQCPLVLKFDSSRTELPFVLTLPTTAAYGEDGQWKRGAIKRQYSDLFDRSMEFFDWWVYGSAIKQGEEPEKEYVEIAFDGLLRAAQMAVCVNYAMGPAELTLIEALDEQSALEVMLAAIDWPSVRRIVDAKKKESLARDS